MISCSVVRVFKCWETKEAIQQLEVASYNIYTVAVMVLAGVVESS